MASSLQFHPVSIPLRVSTNALELRPQLGFKKICQIWSGKKKYRGFFIRVSASSSISGEDNSIKDEVTLAKSVSNGMVVLKYQVLRLQETIVSLPPVVFVVKSSSRSKFALGFCIAASILIVAVLVYMEKKLRHKRLGSVADLVRRGQLNSDRRGISKSVMYDDPFNNPQVKISKNNSTVEMCGKVYKLAPVTLTRDEQNIHQKGDHEPINGRGQQYFLKKEILYLLMWTPIRLDGSLQIILLQPPLATLLKVWLKTTCFKSMAFRSVFRPSMRHCRKNLKLCKLIRS